MKALFFFWALLAILAVQAEDVVKDIPCLDNANAECQVRDQAVIDGLSQWIFTMQPPGDSYVGVEALVEQCGNGQEPCVLPAIIVLPTSKIDSITPNMTLSSLKNTSDTYVWFNVSSLTMYAYFTGRLDVQHDFSLIMLNTDNFQVNVAYAMAFFPTLPGCVAGLVILTLIGLLASFIGPCVNAYFAEKGSDSENTVETYRTEIPDAYILRKLTGKWTIPTLKKEIYGWKVYLAQKSHFLWILFPETDEVLPRTQRVIITGTYLGVVYLLQMIWTKGSQNVVDSVPIQIFSQVIPMGAGPIFLQIFVGHIVGTISFIALQFLGRKTCAQTPLFQEHHVLLLKLAGRWFQSTVWMVFTVVWIINFSLMISLGEYCDCELFSFNLFAPFIGTLISQEAIPGAFLRFLMFCIRNAFGVADAKQFETSESKPLLIAQNT